MKRLMQLEEVAMLIFCIYFLYMVKVDWWIYILLFIGPDISMLGYLGGNKSGAVLYNIFHHKTIAVFIFLLGWINHNTDMQVAGCILFGHSSMDRMFGYGLKHFSGFKYTHLGQIGAANHK